MIDLFDLWERFCGEYNTHQGGHIRPHRNFVNWVNDISNDLFEEKFKTGWQRSQKDTDDIGMPFLKSRVVSVTPGGSTYDLVSYPADYGHFSACRFFHRGDFKAVAVQKCDPDNDGNFYYENTDPELTEVSIELVRNNQWGAITGHVFKKPKIDRPKMTQYQDGFKIAPKGIGTVVLDYLVKPTPGTFVYTVGTDDQIIYDANNSTKLQWSDLVIPEFMSRLGMKYGKFTKQTDIYQYSEKEKTVA